MRGLKRLLELLPEGFNAPPGLTDERLLRWICQRDFLCFCMAVMPEFVPTRFHTYLATELQSMYEDVKRGRDARAFISCPPQHGKLLAHSTPVLTTKGWVTHGDLQVGDFVFGRDGEAKRVEALSSDGVADFEVEFTDGEIIKCHGNHEWVVTDRKVMRGYEKILETKEMYSFGMSAEGSVGCRGNRYRFQVDPNTPVSFKDQALPIPPYVLGAWLGDGKSSGATICAGAKDMEVINKVKSLGFNVSSSWVQKDTGVNYFYFQKLHNLLQFLGVMRNKHIPDEYLISSRNQRLELLAGLIDTDGSVYHKNGRVTFVNVNKLLVEQVRRLVISLGWRVTISKTEPCMSSSGINGKKTCYQLTFNPDDDIPLVIPRKKLKNITSIKRRRAIKSIRKTTSPEAGRCIQVEGGVYLVGERLVPTHNSTIVSQLMPAWILGKEAWPIIAASYSADLAEKNSQFCRSIVDSEMYKIIFPKVRLNQDSTSKAFWQTTKGGSYRAVGVMGGLTGFSGKWLIPDDLLAGQAEADSQVISDSTWAWFKSVFYTRRQDISGIVGIATRWALNDPTGRLMDQQEHYQQMGLPDGSYDKWRYLTFPAIAEEDEEFSGGWHRKKGQVLCPERFTLETMERTKNALISDGKVQQWVSLYQQSPILQENAEFRQEWFKFFEDDQIKDLDLIKFTLVDLAVSQKKRADNTVVMTVGKDRNGPNWYVLEYTSGHLNPPETIEAIFDHHKRHKSTVWIEAVAYQAALESFVLEEQRRREVYFTVNQIKHSYAQKKEDRIRGLVSYFKNGVLFMRRHMVELQKELLQFPKSNHDDHADTLAFFPSIKALTVFAKPEQKKVDNSYTAMFRNKKTQEHFDPNRSFSPI